MTAVHIYPVDDLIEHDTEGDDCVCGVQVEAVFTIDGSANWLISHNSLDGRELAAPVPPADKGRQL